MSFIDSHREALGIEPICRELAIAPSSYHEHATRLADPGKRSARARRDDKIKEQIKRVHDDSSGLYASEPSACVTSETRRLIPARKSIGCVATRTRTSCR